MITSCAAIRLTGVKTGMDKELIRVENLKKYYDIKGGIITHTVSQIQAVDGIDEDVTQAYDQINDLSEELEDLEADLYEDDDADEEDDEPEAEDDADDNADVASEPYYEVACPACGETVYVSEDDLDAGEAICPSCKVAFEVALADDEEPEEDDGPVQYEVTCPACGATAVFEEADLLDGEPTCPNCGKPLDFEVTEE